MYTLRDRAFWKHYAILTSPQAQNIGTTQKEVLLETSKRILSDASSPIDLTLVRSNKLDNSLGFRTVMNIPPFWLFYLLQIEIVDLKPYVMRLG